MKRSGILVGLTSTLLFAIAHGRPAESPQLRLRVTSSNPNQELLFTAAYVFNDADSALERLDTVTPVEFDRSADRLHGIFRQQSEGGILEVRVFQHIRGEWREVLMGDGEVVVVSETQGRRWATSW